MHWYYAIVVSKLWLRFPKTRKMCTSTLLPPRSSIEEVARYCELITAKPLNALRMSMTYVATLHVKQEFVWPIEMAVRYAALSASRKVHVCHCNSLGGATWRSVIDNGTDGQTDRQTDRRTDRVRRNMRPPPREEGRIIMCDSMSGGRPSSRTQFHGSHNPQLRATNILRQHSTKDLVRYVTLVRLRQLA